jgi:plastocyanin
MKKLLLLAPLCAALALTGCATPSGREIKIEMTEYKLTPAQVEVKPGEQITWVLENKGTVDHEFESDEGQLAEAVVPPGKTKNVAWKAPTKPGTYTFECDMAGHDGMEMTVTVKE